MNKVLQYIITIISFGILLSNSMKIGYIDSNRIMNELDEVREIQVELEKEQRKMESEMETLISKRDSLIQSYERQQILMNDQRKLDKQQEIQQISQDIERF